MPISPVASTPVETWIITPATPSAVSATSSHNATRLAVRVVRISRSSDTPTPKAVTPAASTTPPCATATSHVRMLIARSSTIEARYSDSARATDLGRIFTLSIRYQVVVRTVPRARRCAIQSATKSSPISAAGADWVRRPTET